MKRNSMTLLLAAAMGLLAMSIQARPEETTSPLSNTEGGGVCLQQ